MHRGPRILCCFLAALLASPVLPAMASKVSVWRHANKSDFSGHELHGVVLSQEGEITLGRRLAAVCDAKAGSVWCLARTPQGKLLAGTAMPGQVLRVSPEGEAVAVWTDAQQQVFSLAARDDGSVLAGTGPHGTVYRVSPTDEVEQLGKLDCLYVWSLLPAADGGVYAGTGPAGKIFKIDADGTSRVFYETRQPHVLCLARRGDGTLIAGTDGAGLVFAIDPAGQGRVLYDADEDEVRSLWVAADGTIFAGTARGASDASKSSSNSEGGQNALYRIAPDGGVRKIAAIDGLIYSVASPDPSGRGDLFLGTGGEGWLYAVDPEGRNLRQTARLDAEQILALHLDKDRTLLVATGNAGRVHRLSADFVDEGSLVSKVLDASLVAQFGAIDWRGSTPEGTQVAVSVRSGNTSKPDETWSNWGVEHADPATARADCPAGRFLQYRLTLRTRKAGVTPRVQAIAVRYRTANQPPEIAKLVVPRMDEADGKQTLTKLKLSWEVADPNQDDLAFTLRFRKLDWEKWITLKEHLTAKEYEWDVESVPEGMYLLELAASDSPSNPPEAALQTTRTSDPFPVDRAGPQVALKLVGIDAQRTAVFEVTAADTISPLASAAYAVDGGSWTNLFPQDKLFDSPRESFRMELSDLKAGAHVLVVRVRDAAGHTSSADAVFEVREPDAAE